MNHVTTETTTTTTTSTASVIPAVPPVPPAALQNTPVQRDPATAAATGEGTFASFGLADQLQRALNTAGYTTPTPIQLGSIPALLQGRDMLGIAQTGTGKTAAFALPILNAIALKPQAPAPKSVRALILAPTRELVIQIADSFRTYGKFVKLKSCAVYGGVSEFHQIKSMAGGVDVLIATPGRLLDLAQRRHINLSQVQTFVLDEADRMLDMGFIRDVNKLTAMIPEQRQSLLFSATMPNEIAHLAAKLLRDPVRVEVTPAVVTVERIAQKVFFIEAARKRELLTGLLEDPALSRVVVFTRTKHAANRVSDHLMKAGIPSDAIHGNKSQNARQKALENFKKGKARVLVATDIAARGIHVSDISHVINYELPNQPESYVHRIGRTARAGAEGIALSFCDRAERGFLKDIERFTKRAIPVGEHTFAGPGTGESDSRDGRRGPRSFGGGNNRDRDQERERGGRGGFGGKREGGRGERSHGGPKRSFENRDRSEGQRADAPREHSHREHAPREQGERHFENRGPRPEHRPHGERNHAERGHTERSAGGDERPMNRAQHDRSHAERHFGPERHREHRPEGARFENGRPEGARSEGEHRSPKPHGGKPGGYKAGGYKGNKPHGGKPGGGKPHGKPHGQRNEGPRQDQGGDRPLRRPHRAA